MSPDGRGVFGLASADTGPARGGSFQSDSTGGVGARGFAGADSGSTIGLFGEVASPEGVGVKGLANATAGLGVPYGGYFQSDGHTLGIGVHSSGSWTGVEGETETGRGVHGSATGTDGFGFGVYGESHNNNGFGVYGRATDTNGFNYGGYFTSDSFNGIGVYASGELYGRAFLTPDTYGIAVRGLADSEPGGAIGVYGESASVNGIDVYGYAPNIDCNLICPIEAGVIGEAPGTLFGVYAIGRFGASGSKSFCIDHPDDPENKYLLHYSAESPEVVNFYSGTATLDAAGEVSVKLPNYFSEINRDPRYFLTPIGAPMPRLHVAEKIEMTASPAQFKVAGGEPNKEVCWEVKAIRNDARVRAYGAPVEVEKEGAHRGRYQHPELYSQPPERGMNHELHQRARRMSAEGPPQMSSPGGSSK